MATLVNLRELQKYAVFTFTVMFHFHSHGSTSFSLNDTTLTLSLECRALVAQHDSQKQRRGSFLVLTKMFSSAIH